MRWPFGTIWIFTTLQNWLCKIEHSAMTDIVIFVYNTPVNLYRGCAIYLQYASRYNQCLNKKFMWKMVLTVEKSTWKSTNLEFNLINLVNFLNVNFRFIFGHQSYVNSFRSDHHTHYLWTFTQSFLQTASFTRKSCIRTDNLSSVNETPDNLPKQCYWRCN